MKLSVFLCSSVMFSVAAAAPVESYPLAYELAWTVGSCRNCEIVKGLDGPGLFTSSTIVAGAVFFPTEGQGSGDYSVVQSMDGGRHWLEIAKSRMHATAPSISFIDGKTGWMSGMKMDGSTWVVRTDDAGAHWRMKSEHFIQQMHFINRLIGFGSEFDGVSDDFAKTVDGGRTWIDAAVPRVRFIDKVLFLTPEIGWLAGTSGSSQGLRSDKAFVLRTTDGGKSWTPSQIPSSQGVAGIQDLFFLNASDGWLITWHFNNDGTHLFHTTDGGKTWRLHPDQAIQGQGKWLSCVQFLNPQVGFAFGRYDQVDARAEPPATGVVAVAEAGPTETGRLLYTRDGGEHWQSRPLGAWIDDCKVVGSELGCTALKETPGFWSLRVRLRTQLK